MKWFIEKEFPMARLNRGTGTVERSILTFTKLKITKLDDKILLREIFH